MEDGLFGTVIGALITFCSLAFFNYRTHKFKKESLAKAFKGEISALLSIIDENKYIEKFEKAYRENNPKVVLIKQNYFEIYQSNCKDIGMLSADVAEEIAKFYVFCKSFIENINAYCSEINVHNVAIYPELIALLHKINKSGNMIILKIDNEYAQK